MSDTDTLQTVKYVKELPPGDVFREGTDNRLYQAGDGTYIASSWCPGTDKDPLGETAVWESDEDGYPTDALVARYGFGNTAVVDGNTPAHEEALAEFGYRVVSEDTE